MAIRDTCKFGAFYDGGSYPSGLARIQAWEDRYGIRMDIINNFRKAGYYNTPGGSGHVTTAINSMQATGIDGRRHCMTWEWTSTTGSTKFTEPLRPYDLLNGSMDAYITEMATALAQWGAEVYIRLFHEMNGNWYGWALDPKCLIDAWQRIHGIFQSVGATNVKWYWCANGGDAPSWNKMESYYPGHAYVDVVGFDQYNAYTGWHSFSSLIDTPYAKCRALAPSKKIWIGETGTPEGSTSISGWAAAGSPTKSQWYEEMFAATGFDEIEYILMFDAQGGYNWKIDTTTASRDTFATLVQAAALTTDPPSSSLNAGKTTTNTEAQS